MTFNLQPQVHLSFTVLPPALSPFEPSLLAMFSFAKIATLAALAFGTFASAIPAPAPAPEAGALEARTVSPTVTTVLNNLLGDLQER